LPLTSHSDSFSFSLKFSWLLLSFLSGMDVMFSSSLNYLYLLEKYSNVCSLRFFCKELIFRDVLVADDILEDPFAF
jgi:hypothetical protein